MEKPSRLADLKLVNKYYPVNGVANYSYPSPKTDSPPTCGSLTGRSSISSQASVPGMVEDQESDVSIDGDDRSSYHISGAELWDSFWEDPFWEANAEEASREQADGGITRTVISRNASYPALLLSPEETQPPKDQYFLKHRSDGPSAEFPDPRRKPITPKASYSLFPRPTPISILVPVPNHTPRNQNLPLNLPPRTSSLSQSPKHSKSSISLSSLARSTSKAKRAHLSEIDVTASSYGRSSWTHSAPVTPRVIDRPSSAVDLSARRGSNQSLLQRLPIRLPRTRSEIFTSRSSVISIRNSASITMAAPPKTTTAPPPPVVAIAARSLSPERPRERYSQQQQQKPQPSEGRRRPSPLQLHRCKTESNLASYHNHQHHSQAHTPTRFYCETSPSSPALPRSPDPMPVSVFELDSDSEDEEEGGTSLARRIARSLAPGKRTRSASATPRSRRGLEIAKDQLRRAMAGSSSSSSSASASASASPSASSSSGADEVKEDKEAGGGPVLRRQKSEIFGKMFWGRR